MTLLELQRHMFADVTRPLTPDFLMHPSTDDGASVEQRAASYIKPNNRLSSFDRLEIYNRQYWFRVIGAVAEDFPALQAVVGTRKFDTLILAFLRDNPSTSFTLRNLGAKLPQWLEAHPEYSSTRRQLSLDVARLEWAYVEAYDGAAMPPLTEAAFANLDGDSVLFLQPHLQLLSLKYPVDELVLAVREASPSLDIVSNAVSERRQARRFRLPAMRRVETYLAVHRFDDSVYYRRLDREAYLLLSALQQNTTLATAIDAAFAGSKLTDEDKAGKVQSYFAHAARLGWFCNQPPATADPEG